MGYINILMNHKSIYDKLVERAKLRGAIADSHRHHICPVSLGGSNRSGNLVHLTYREHFLAHALLVRMYPVGSIERFKMLCAMRRLDRDKRFGSRAFAKSQMELNAIMSKRMSGAGNPNFGGVLQTPEVKAKMRKPRKDTTKLGRWERTVEYREAKAAVQRTASHFVSSNPMNSAEMRAKVAASKIGRRAHHHPGQPGVRKMYVPGEAPPGWSI